MKHKALLTLLIILFSVTVISGGYLLINNEQLTTNKRIETTSNNGDSSRQRRASVDGGSIPQNDPGSTSSLRSLDYRASSMETIASSSQNTEYKIPDTKYPVTITVNTTTYPLSVSPSTTVYDAMRLLQIDSRQPFLFSAKEYAGIGMFVEEINGVKNDTSAQKYWIMYVNGQSASVGASGYVLREEDKIEWRLEKSEF